MLSRYARERLLYRLSVSDHREQFILKGALLFSYWTGAPHRPTRDLDTSDSAMRWCPGQRRSSSPCC